MTQMESSDKNATVQQRRRKARRSSNDVRKRQLFDIVEIAHMFKREGLLSALSTSDDRFEEQVVSELSVVAAISPHGAKKVLKLMGIRHNNKLWSFLKKSSRFSIFEDVHFIKSYTSIKTGDGALFLDFLEAFINGEGPKILEQKLNKKRKLDYISLHYKPEARDHCISMFFKIVCVVATLCGFVHTPSDLDKTKAMDIVQRYLSETWTSDSAHKQYKSQSNRIYLVDGWRLVMTLINEVFKIQVEELLSWKQQRTSENPIANAYAKHAYVTEEDVKNNAHRFCHQVLSEFIAWCFHVIPSGETDGVDDFVDGVLDVFLLVSKKLSKDIKCVREEEIAEDFIISKLQLIDMGEPTLAEVRYDATSMTPTRKSAKTNRKVLWNVMHVVMRCRWPNSPAEKTYSALKHSSDVENKSDEASGFPSQKQSQADPEGEEGSTSRNEDATGTAANECVPGTPEPQTPEYLSYLFEDGDAPLRKQLGKRGYAEVSKSNPHGSTNMVPQQIKKEDSRKRLRACLQASVLRLEKNNQQLQQARHEKGLNPSRVEKLGVNYLDDGEESEGEQDRAVTRPAAEAQRMAQDSRSSRDTNNIPGEDTEQNETNIAVQTFYEIILDWPIVPVSNGPLLNMANPRTTAEKMAASDLIAGDAKWLEFFCTARKFYFQQDVTNAPHIVGYREHWKNILPIEVRGMVSEEIANLLPSLKEGESKDWINEIDKERFLTVKVESVTPLKELFHLDCKSINPLINKRIAYNLRGGTLCVAYVTGPRLEHSPLLLTACRRVHWDNDDLVPLGATEAIDEIQLHLAISRARIRGRGIWPGDLVCLFQVCHFSTHLRMFKSVQEVHCLPQQIHNVLYGNGCPPRMTAPEEMERRIDASSAAYLTSQKAGGNLNVPSSWLQNRFLRISVHASRDQAAFLSCKVRREPERQRSSHSSSMLSCLIRKSVTSAIPN